VIAHVRRHTLFCRRQIRSARDVPRRRTYSSIAGVCVVGSRIVWHAAWDAGDADALCHFAFDKKTLEYFLYKKNIPPK
jgi:hypothetical protein